MCFHRWVLLRGPSSYHCRATYYVRMGQEVRGARDEGFLSPTLEELLASEGLGRYTDHHRRRETPHGQLSLVYSSCMERLSNDYWLKRWTVTTTLHFALSTLLWPWERNQGPHSPGPQAPPPRNSRALQTFTMKTELITLPKTCPLSCVPVSAEGLITYLGGYQTRVQPQFLHHSFRKDSLCICDIPGPMLGTKKNGVTQGRRSPCLLNLRVVLNAARCSLFITNILNILFTMNLLKRNSWII